MKKSTILINKVKKRVTTGLAIAALCIGTSSLAVLAAEVGQIVSGEEQSTYSKSNNFDYRDAYIYNTSESTLTAKRKNGTDGHGTVTIEERMYTGTNCYCDVYFQAKDSSGTYVTIGKVAKGAFPTVQYTYFTNRPIPTGDITLTATARENDGQTGDCISGRFIP